MSIIRKKRVKKMDVEKFLGQEVNLKGIAKDAKGGAVLITSDNHVIYIKGLEFWPSRFLDEQVLVKGVLKKEKLIPDPVIDEEGAISCGATGDQLVLDDAEYSKTI